MKEWTNGRRGANRWEPLVYHYLSNLSNNYYDYCYYVLMILVLIIMCICIYIEREMYVRVYIYIYIHIIIVTQKTLARGNRLSNTTCLTQAFFKSDE